jgi:hypothetical protein
MQEIGDTEKQRVSRPLQCPRGTARRWAFCPKSGTRHSRHRAAAQIRQCLRQREVAHEVRYIWRIQSWNPVCWSADGETSMLGFAFDSEILVDRSCGRKGGNDNADDEMGGQQQRPTGYSLAAGPVDPARVPLPGRERVDKTGTGKKTTRVSFFEEFAARRDPFLPNSVAERRR